MRRREGRNVGASGFVVSPLVSRYQFVRRDVFHRSSFTARAVSRRSLLWSPPPGVSTRSARGRALTFARRRRARSRGARRRRPGPRRRGRRRTTSPGSGRLAPDRDGTNPRGWRREPRRLGSRARGTRGTPRAPPPRRRRSRRAPPRRVATPRAPPRGRRARRASACRPRARGAGGPGGGGRARTATAQRAETSPSASPPASSPRTPREEEDPRVCVRNALYSNDSGGFPSRSRPRAPPSATRRSASSGVRYHPGDAGADVASPDIARRACDAPRRTRPRARRRRPNEGPESSEGGAGAKNVRGAIWTFCSRRARRLPPRALRVDARARSFFDDGRV